MNKRISEHSISIDRGFTPGVTQGIEDDEYAVFFTTGDSDCKFDFDIDQLIRFRNCINDAIEEVFRIRDDLQCPACGYTQHDVNIHNDHKLCRS